MVDEHTTRAEMIGRMREQQQKIADIFNDADHWNRVHSDEEPIDPDPDGVLTRIAHRLNTSLAREETKH